MTDRQLTEFLFENGADLYSFKIVNDDKIFENGCVDYEMGAYPVWTSSSLNKFINNINKSEGIHYIYNGFKNHCTFKATGDFLLTYHCKTTLDKRRKKLGKLNYEIFKKQIIDTLQHQG